MIIDLYLIVVLSAVGFQTSVKSFSIVPSIPSSTIKVITLPSTTRLYATTGQTTINRSNSKPSDDFWGSPRSSEEIEHFVSDAIFDKNMRGGEQEKNNYDSSQVVNEKQWVEVISAEPPVSRSDSSRSYNTLSLLKETVVPIRYNTPIYIYIYSY